MSPIGGYETLLALAEREANLIAMEDWAALEELTVERAAIVAFLPAEPPPEAADALRRLVAAQAMISGALTAARDRTRGEMRTMGTRRTAVRGYAAANAQT